MPTLTPAPILAQAPPSPVAERGDTDMPEQGMGVAIEEVPVLVETQIPNSPNPTESEPIGIEDVSFSVDEEGEEAMVEEDLSDHEDESPAKDGDSRGVVLSSGASLSAHKWEELKRTNPIKALEVRLSGRTSSGSRPNTSTHSAGTTTTATSTESLLQAFRTQILEGDVFQAIEADPPLAFQVKSLLCKLADLDVEGSLNESVSNFVVTIQPLFDQLVKDIQKKGEHNHLLQLEIKRQKDKTTLVETTRATVASLKAKSNAERKAIEDCDAEIKIHEESIALLQSKIQELEKKKETLMRSSIPADLLKNQLEQEAIICLQHLEELEHCTATVEKLSKDGNFLNRRISAAKALFNDLKSKVTL